VVRDPWGSAVKLTHTRMRYEVTLELREARHGIERVQVAHEAAYPILRKEDQWVNRLRLGRQFRDTNLRYGRTKPWLTTEDRTEGLTFSIHQDGKQGRTRPASAAEATVLYSITNAEFPHLFALREEMRSWRLLQLDPALLRRPVPVTAPDILAPDGSNLAAVLARLKAETASSDRPNGVLSDIAAELNHLIPGVSKLNADLHQASREYRIELTMRDGLPFSSRVISDGTLRVLALLTLLHDPKHGGLICFEEPENGVHPARIRPLMERLQELVTDPMADAEGAMPLTQLLLNSHSPVVLSSLLDEQRHPVHGAVLFADTTVVADPINKEARRKTRLRLVPPKEQPELFESILPPGFVSDLEVKKVLETVASEG
jgi:hypothetical protein